jgi:putative hydrolase of the HAD superfamily
LITAVTFDYWNTLCAEQAPGYLRGLRIDAWLGLLEDAGFATERAMLDAAFDTAWQRHVRGWTAGEAFGHTAAAETILEATGHDVPDDLRAALLEAFVGVGEDADVRLTPNVAETIRALKAAGIKIGIVCDVGFTPSPMLRRYLERHRLLDAFDHWSFSDEVGCYKPDPRIFTHALDGLGADPKETAHVGDLRRTDVAGARAMGMTAIRYTGLYDDDSQAEPEGDHVIADHRDLPGLLGVVPH